MVFGTRIGSSHSQPPKVQCRSAASFRATEIGDWTRQHMRLNHETGMDDMCPEKKLYISQLAVLK